MIRIGIIGTRSRDTQLDYQDIRDAYIKCVYENQTYDNEEIIIISGGCKTGGDRFAEIIAKEFKRNILTYPAKWNEYGKSAGAIRNKLIAKESDYLIACVSKDRTGGTEITIKEFIKLKGDKNMILV